MNKDSLLEILNELWNIHLLGTAGSLLFLSDKGLEILEKSSLSMYGQGENLKELANLMRHKNEKAKNIVIFNEALRDFILRDQFSYVVEYCESTKQEDVLKKMDWYQFARVLRNYLSHGKQFDPNYYDKNLFPIRWKNNIIEWESIIQNNVDFKKFKHTMVRELFEEIRKFAKTLD